MSETILISACLLGSSCRYDGKNKKMDRLEDLMEHYHLIPVCPEIYGGMSTPRLPSECKNGRVVSKTGEDVTEFFQKGAEETLYLAKLYGCTKALLKGKSPSCGYREIYDGSFSGKLTAGNGLAAGMLADAGIAVYHENEIDKLL
jgi:uncharacterized protein YbbK (DUF523 family)